MPRYRFDPDAVVAHNWNSAYSESPETDMCQISTGSAARIVFLTDLGNSNRLHPYLVFYEATDSAIIIHTVQHVSRSARHAGRGQINILCRVQTSIRGVIKYLYGLAQRKI
jgi:hypothetical protein